MANPGNCPSLEVEIHLGFLQYWPMVRTEFLQIRRPFGSLVHDQDAETSLSGGKWWKKYKRQKYRQGKYMGKRVRLDKSGINCCFPECIANFCAISNGKKKNLH